MGWQQIQTNIASCAECTARWPSAVRRPLAVGEIPNPPEQVRLLFVGVAPTPDEGSSRGGHFYASANDKLRAGLFGVLSETPFNLPLSRLPVREANHKFFQAGFFFVHAAKVRPITTLSPPHDCIRHCARRHLKLEIEHLAPLAVCFLGLGNAAPAAQELFGAQIGTEPNEAKVGNWSGFVAVAPQPVRGNAPRIKNIVAELLRLSETSLK